MVKLKFNLLSPVEVAALLCALLIYSKVLPVNPRHPFVAVPPEEKITKITGVISSNPSITSKRTGYVFKVKADSVEADDGSAECSGEALVFCDKSIVEAHYPGKLYSKSGNVIEQGALVSLEVSAIESEGNMPFFRCISLEMRGWKNKFCRLRGIFRMQFKRLMFQWKGAGGLLLALLSGSREYTDETLANGFKNAGLSHILALSGMHLSFFSGLAAKAAMKAFGKKYTSILSLLAILCFVWFAGISPSLFRALLCSSLVLLCGVLHLKTSLLSILSLSFLLHLFFAPQDANAISFIFSYGALLGILCFSKIIDKYLVPIIPNKISASLASSIGAQFFTAPISIIVFGTFMPIGIIATVLISPLISVFMLLGFVFVVASLIFPPLLLPLGAVLNIVYNVIEFGVGIFAKVPPISF